MSALMTVGEAAKRIGVHVDTLKNWTKAGQLSIVKLGHRTYRIAPEDLDQFISSRKVRSRRVTHSMEHGADIAHD
jgi:excisionase family DNA binding protein